MKKNSFKISILTVVILCFSLNMFGCSDNKEDNVKETRYSEEEINLPNINNIYDLSYKDNIISFLGKSDDNTLIRKNFSESKWSDQAINIHYEGKITNDDSCLKSLYEDKSIQKYVPIDASLSDNGNIAYIDYNKEQANGKEFKDYSLNHNIFTTDKKTINFDVANNILSTICNISYIGGKDLFAMSSDKIYQYDEQNGKLKFIYNFDKEKVLSECSIYDNLYVATADGMQKYDTNTGEKLEDIDSLKEYINPSTKIFKGIGTNMIISSSKGLFSFKTNDGKITKILDGSNTLIGDSTLNVQKIIEYSGTNSNYEYLILYKDLNNKYKLYKYKYSEELSSKELTQVKVYSLYEDYNIENLVRKYQKNNQDLKVNYEFGISDNREATEDDAIKKLNTEIMAGKGPDILFLDGMSYDYYEKKGILDNLDDIVKDNKDNLFSSVTSSFYNGNKIYMMPLYFKIPIIVGKDSVVNDTEDLDSLSSSIEKNLKNQDVSIFQAYNPEDLINMMYYASCSNFVEGKNLNKESVKGFLENVKKIYDISKEKINKNEYKLYNEESSKFMKKYGDSYAFSRNNYLNKCVGVNNFVKKDITNLDVGYASNLEEISKITSVIKNRDDISYKYFTGNKEKSFLPVDIISVNAKSKKKKIARKIVSDLLSDDYYDVNKDSPFSINKNISESIFNSNKENKKLGSFGIGNDNGEVECKIEWLDDKNYNYLLDCIDSVDKSTNTNVNVLDSIVEYGKEYVSGSASIDNTLDNISKDVNLKLSE